MITKKQTAGSLYTSRPSISTAIPLDDPEEIIKRAKSFDNDMVLKTMRTLLEGEVAFICEVTESNQLAIGTSLSLDTRSALLEIVGEENFITLLEALNPHIDKAFELTFSPIEEWLDEKYLKRDVSEELVNALAYELYNYNNTIKDNGYKHFTHYLLEVLLQSDFIGKFVKYNN